MSKLCEQGNDETNTGGYYWFGSQYMYVAIILVIDEIIEESDFFYIF